MHNHEIYVFIVKFKIYVRFLLTFKNFCSIIKMQERMFAYRKHYRMKFQQSKEEKMKQMIKAYEQSCVLVKQRIIQLTKQRNKLKKEGKESIIEELDLERRIRLLYTEHSQMKEIVIYLTNYVRRVEQRAET